MKSRFFAGAAMLAAGIVMLTAALIMGLCNVSDELNAEKSSRQAAALLFDEIFSEGLIEAESESDSDAHLSVIEIDGSRYVGILTIPKLSLELPVLSTLSSPGLKTAPCLYSGSIETKDAVIAAHNYSAHFGELYTLSIGDEVYFTCVDGSIIRYEVAEIETLRAYETQRMTESGYDLTLFTCTVGGRQRVTVRCTEA